MSSLSSSTRRYRREPDPEALVICPDCYGTGEDGALHACSSCHGDGALPVTALGTRPPVLARAER